MSAEEKYKDIIDLPHHQSTKHQHMSVYDRAAQFAPFAALTGHEESIGQTAGEHLEDVLASEHGEMFIEDC